MPRLLLLDFCIAAMDLGGLGFMDDDPTSDLKITSKMLPHKKILKNSCQAGHEGRSHLPTRHATRDQLLRTRTRRVRTTSLPVPPRPAETIPGDRLSVSIVG